MTFTFDALTKLPQHTKLHFCNPQAEQENIDYYTDEHIKYWIGSQPDEKDPHKERVWREIKRVFVSANFVKECVDRHVEALIGNFPEIKLKSKNDGQPTAIIEAGEKEINNWLSYMFRSAATQESCEDMNPIIQALTRMCVLGRGYLRLFTRSRYKYSEDFYKKVSLHAPDRSQIRMFYDAEGSLEAIEYLFSDRKIERQELDPVTGVLHFKIYRDESDKEKDITLDEYDLDLNHNWSIVELKAPALITRSIKSLQNAINLDLTMLARNVVQAGFLERLLLNAQTPGEFIESERGDLEFIPDPMGYRTGPGSTAIVTGIPIGDNPNNPENYTNPSVVFRDPVDVTTFEKTLLTYVPRLYHEFGQGHLLSAGDGSISGVSRIQLSMDFSNKLKRHIETIENSLEMLSYAALLMLSHYSGKTEAYKKVETVVELSLQDHLLTPEEHKEIRDDFTAGIMSHETTLQLLDVGDPVAEIERKTAERDAEMKMTMQYEEFTNPPVTTANKKAAPSTKKAA